MSQCPECFNTMTRLYHKRAWQCHFCGFVVEDEWGWL